MTSILRLLSDLLKIIAGTLYGLADLWTQAIDWLEEGI